MPHSQNLKKLDKIILEHNFKVADLSGLERLALCFDSCLWKEFLSKLRFLMQGQWVCLYWLIFLVPFGKGACISLPFWSLHAFILFPFLQVSAKLSSPQILHTCITSNISVLSSLACGRLILTSGPRLWSGGAPQTPSLALPLVLCQMWAHLEDRDGGKWAFNVIRGCSRPRTVNFWFLICATKTISSHRQFSFFF